MDFSSIVKRIFHVQANNCGSDTIYYVVDVETPNRSNNRISSIAYTKMHGSAVLGTKNTLVNPEAKFDEFNEKLTGITSAQIRRAPTFPLIWHQLERELRQGIFVAHNAPFDLSVLCKCCQAYGIPFDPVQYIDTLQIAKDVFPQLAHHKLNDLCNELHIPLDHHHSDSDSRACAEILQYFIRSGVPVDRYTCVFTAEDCAQSHVNNNSYINRKPRNLNVTSKSINQLQDLLKNIAADGIVTEGEVRELNAWLTNHLELKGNFPFDQIYGAVEHAMADGILEAQELQDILDTCLFLIDPVQYAPHYDCIDLHDKTVCISGLFECGTEEEVLDLLTRNGAIIKSSVVSTLDYLVVGNCGCKAWSTGNYGNKVKKAIEWQCKGKSIKIIRESDLLQSIKY